MCAVIIHNMIPLLEMECVELQFRNPRGCGGGGRTVNFNINADSFREPRNRGRRYRVGVPLALNTGGDSLGTDDGQGRLNDGNSGLGQTRLGEIVSSTVQELIDKLNSARKNFPMKVFLLLLGFYTANALATILGQTGDWDVLVAGIVVASIEAIGMLMYRKPSRIPLARLRGLAVFVNYWKAGVCLGLFVDAFKLGS